MSEAAVPETYQPTFYHGTRAGFSRGGYLMPRTFHGKTGTTAPLRAGCTERPDAKGYVYITTSRLVAWVYAWHAVGRGKPKVLTVAPCGPIYHDPEHGPDMEAYRCEMARVVSVDTDPLVDEEEARNGWVDA